MAVEKDGSPQVLARNVAPGVLPKEWVRRCPYIEVSYRCSCAMCPHDRDPLHVTSSGCITCCNVMKHQEAGI